MQSFLANRYQEAKSKLVRKAGVGSSGRAVEVGERIYDNGATYTGDFSGGAVDGQGKLVLPEGTVLKGTFRNNRFVEGEIVYFNQVKVECQVGFNEKSDDDYLKNFCFHLGCGYKVTGTCKVGGNIQVADVLDREGNLVSRFSGHRVKLPVWELPGTLIIVTRTWVYEGLIQASSQKHSQGGKNPESIEFGSQGTQIWTKGFGYFRIEPKGEAIAKRLLRVYKKLCFYREIVSHQNDTQCSMTCYANGLFFLTGNDSNRGRLAILRQNGSLASFQCTLQDVIAVDGYIELDNRKIRCKIDDDSQIYFFEKGAQLLLEDLIV